MFTILAEVVDLPWGIVFGGATIAIALVGALIAVISRLVKVEVKVEMLERDGKDNKARLGRHSDAIRDVGGRKRQDILKIEDLKDSEAG